MTVSFFTFEKYHARKNVGSTKIRVHNLIKYWPEASLYKYGEHPDVLIFQKVYVQPDFDLHKTYPGIKILDICDPDWLDNARIKETIDAVDAVTCPTLALKDFLSQMTDKPVVQIKDRFDLAEFPATPKTHKGKAKSLVWFGYVHNASKLKTAMHAISELGLDLTVISNKNPGITHWAESGKYGERAKFIEYDPKTINQELAKHDIAILPLGDEPQDRFKSENKEIISNLCGLPVVKNRDELELMLDPDERNKEVQHKHKLAKENFNVIISIEEYKSLINELRSKTGGRVPEQSNPI